MALKVHAQRGRFYPGFLVGLLTGLVLALGVALYVSKVPSPFVDKVPARSAELDAADAEKSRNWDPNAPLAGKAGQRAATGTVSSEPSTTSTAPAAAQTAPAADTAAARAAELLGLHSAASAPAELSAKPATGALSYYVQVGAYTRSEDAEAQRARLAMTGLTARLSEREQSGRIIYRVRLGPFEVREDAESVRERVASAGYAEATLVPVPR